MIYGPLSSVGHFGCSGPFWTYGLAVLNVAIGQGCTNRGPQAACGPWQGPLQPPEDWRKLPLFVARNELLTIVQTEKQ